MPDRISFSRHELLAALNLIGKVRPWQREYREPGKPNQLGLALIKISTWSGVATLTSANLDITISVDVPCGPGDTTMYLPLPNLLAATQKAAEGAEIVLEAGDGVTVFRAGRFRSQMAGSTRDMAPVRPPLDGARHTIPADTMRGGLRAAAPAVLDDSKRPFMGGVLLRGDGQSLSFVGMDDNRIHSAVGNNGGIDTNVIMPEALADLLAAILPEGKDVQVTIDQRAIELVFDRIRVGSNLIQGQFPAYRERLHTGKTRVYRAPASKLLNDIELVALVAPDKTRDIRFDFGPQCEVSAFRRSGNGVDVGCVVLEGAYEGPPLAIGFQVRLVTDALTLFGHEPIEWRMDGPLDPTVVTCPTLPGIEAMISPLRLVADHLRVAA
ncbi:DNA polymerase III subunit beta family protein [Sphingomonas abietis]|uniref:Beta sliding clamp n=1 Tax=Sphingomonas abietis TaxID=3012344 RepID=A0ABY7NX37_9SPHN|nr:hypothetical protein [Sphingomonas abietis]WBO23961.1 hypothetical protein PBT88_07580 [Sphingomonas abietis]